MVFVKSDQFFVGPVKRVDGVVEGLLAAKTRFEFREILALHETVDFAAAFSARDEGSERIQITGFQIAEDGFAFVVPNVVVEKIVAPLKELTQDRAHFFEGLVQGLVVIFKGDEGSPQAPLEKRGCFQIVNAIELLQGHEEISDHGVLQPLAFEKFRNRLGRSLNEVNVAVTGQIHHDPREKVVPGQHRVFGRVLDPGRGLSPAKSGAVDQIVMQQ